METPRPLSPHPDRLLAPDPQGRAVARRIDEQVRDLPIISPHRHVPASWLSEDQPSYEVAYLPYNRLADGAVHAW